MPKLEREYQPTVIARLENEFPGCFIFKNDEQLIQGIPDLTVLYGDRWAILETKRSDPNTPGSKSKYEPNQEYYIQKLHRMGYASMICPENADQVFAELHAYFGPNGWSR